MTLGDCDMRWLIETLQAVFRLPEPIKVLVYGRSSAGESELGTGRKNYEEHDAITKLAEL